MANNLTGGGLALGALRGRRNCGLMKFLQVNGTIFVLFFFQMVAAFNESLTELSHFWRGKMSQ